ncbi:Glycoside hydrolase protein [Neofusicoccum parvum]|uniref:Glycoside hydrolase protein n=1 Tax=Neofusicoccum parvum TaxID=310453 RepID=A0ACB5S3V4_9PEZI|nr:Glycoside hydrolase protein [Neofusicoccum parvum]
MDAAGSGVAPSWLAPLLLGVLFHAVVRRIEIDMFLLPIAGAFGALGIAYVCLSVRLFHATFFGALASLSSGTALFTLGLVGSMLVYRAFFHRLRRFPGPLAARLSKLYMVRLSAKNLQLHLELKRLHEEYGDVVRTGPRELTIFHPNAIPYIAACRKSSMYQLSDRRDERLGLIETRDIEDHRRRRRPWEMALNTKSITKYDPMMQSTITQLLNALSSPERAGKPINVTEWIAYLAYDLMGVVGFGNDFGQLTGGGEEHWAVKALRSQQVFFGYLKPVPWLINAAVNIPGADAAVRPFVDYCKGLVVEKRAAGKSNTSTPSDILSWILEAYDEKSPHAPPTQEALDEDARTIVTAGADTTSNTLTCALYHLARHPTIYTALQTQLTALFPSGPHTFTYAALQTAPPPLLDAIIHETLRLAPATPSGNPRVTPPSGLLIPATATSPALLVPGDTDVYVPPYVVQRDARFFPAPDAFVPGRWLAGGEEGAVPGMAGERGAFFPFQVGQYACVGKALAMWEMRSVLARVALGFDLGFAEGGGGEGFEEGMRDTFTITLGPLWMVFTEREGVRQE